MINLRYLRQISLLDIGLDGQEYIKKSRILCVGAGGLGAPVLIYLASSGVGTIGIVDMDVVNISDLNRQVLFNMSDVGKKKVDVAVSFISRLNSDIIVNSYDFCFDENSAPNLISLYDIVIDCTDNLKAKYFINYYSVKFNIPMVYGAIYGFEGYISTFYHIYGACYNCLYDNVSLSYLPNCSEYGVIGSVTGVIGSLQAMEAIKLILYLKLNSKIKNLISRLLIFNLKKMDFTILNIKKKKTCNVCSNFLNNGNIVSDNFFFEMYNDCYVLKSDLSTFGKITIFDVSDNINYSFKIDNQYIDFLKLPFPVLMSLNNIDKLIKYDIIYVFICEYGVRSKLVCKYLRLKGFKNVFYLINDI